MRPMGFFATELSRLMQDRTQAEVSTASGILRGTLSLYASGDRGISVNALGELLRAFPDKEDQLALVAAHLQDEIPNNLHGAITIEFPRTSRVEEASPNAKPLDVALHLIRLRAESDEDVRRLVLDLERILR